MAYMQGTCICKKVKARMSQRLKWPEFIPVPLLWSMPWSIATLPPPGRDTSPSQGYPQQCGSPVPTNLYTWVKVAETKLSKIPCLRKQHDGWVRLERRTSRSIQPRTPLHGLQVRPLITYRCQLCFP